MDHSSIPPFLLAVLALLSPVFSSQLFPEWQSWSWRLPSHRSQIPLVAEHRSHEEVPTLGQNNFPREISRLSRDSSNSEKYFQYLNIPSQKVNFRKIKSKTDFLSFFKEYEFGWHRGNPEHFTSRFEQGKDHRFRTRVNCICPWNIILFSYSTR